MDEGLAGRALVEGVDDIGVDDVGKLIALLEEALNVLLKGLVCPLPVVVEIPRVP